MFMGPSGEMGAGEGYISHGRCILTKFVHSIQLGKPAATVMKFLELFDLDSVDISVPEHSHLYRGIVPHHEAEGLMMGTLLDDPCVLAHQAVFEPLDT